MTRCALAIVLATFGVSSCAVHAPSLPQQGLIATSDDGAVGYQHGPDGSGFEIGHEVRRMVQFGYVKHIGNDGTLAISRGNGSVFGVPNAGARSVRLPPFGTSPSQHDTFIRDYFVKLGLPVEQVETVRGMTLLEANGRSDEAVRTIPRAIAYYSVITRVVNGIPVPDSFAWARANSESRIVQEAVYWPALPRDVLTQAARFKEMLADTARRRALQSRIPVDISAATLVIRHASVTESQFEAFASLDVALSSSSPAKPGMVEQRGATPSIGGMAVIRHFDIDGSERLLPQERLDLKDRYSAKKSGVR